MTRIRRDYVSGGEWGADGRWIAPDTNVESTIDITVDPVPDELVDTLPVGTARKDAIYIITEADLRTDDDDAEPQEVADLIVRAGYTYKVVHVERFARLIVHWEAVAVRVKNPGISGLEVGLESGLSS